MLQTVKNKDSSFKARVFKDGSESQIYYFKIFKSKLRNWDLITSRSQGRATTRVLDHKTHLLDAKTHPTGGIAGGHGRSRPTNLCSCVGVGLVPTLLRSFCLRSNAEVILDKFLNLRTQRFIGNWRRNLHHLGDGFARVFNDWFFCWALHWFFNRFLWRRHIENTSNVFFTHTLAADAG